MRGAYAPLGPLVFLCWWLRLWFWFLLLRGWWPHPPGLLALEPRSLSACAESNQRHTQGRGVSIYLRAKSLAALGCAPKRACGRSPSPLGTSLLPTKKRASALFFDLFPGMQRGKVSAENHRKRSTHALIECGQRPQSTEIDTMPIEKSHPTLQPNAAQRAAEHRAKYEKSISAEQRIVPPAERQRRKRGKACERCSNFKHDL